MEFFDRLVRGAPAAAIAAPEGRFSLLAGVSAMERPKRGIVSRMLMLGWRESAFGRASNPTQHETAVTSREERETCLESAVSRSTGVQRLTLQVISYSSSLAFLVSTDVCSAKAIPYIAREERLRRASNDGGCGIFDMGVMG